MVSNPVPTLIGRAENREGIGKESGITPLSPQATTSVDEEIRKRLGAIYGMPSTLQWSHVILTAYLSRKREITLEHLALIERYYAAPRNPRNPLDKFRRNNLGTLLEHWGEEVGHALAWDQARLAKEAQPAF